MTADILILPETSAVAGASLETGAKGAAGGPIRSPDVPSWSGIWTDLMGGKEAYLRDRQIAATLENTVPGMAGLGRDRCRARAALTRHVTAQGVDQLVVAGTDFPLLGMGPEIHEVADGAAVLYTDDNPLVRVHAQAIYEKSPVAEAAPGDPDALIAAARKHLDLARPVGFVWVTTLDLLDDATAAAVLAAVAAAAAPGILAVAHVSTEVKPVAEALAGACEERRIPPLRARTPGRVRGLLEEAGLEVIPPGVVPASALPSAQAERDTALLTLPAIIPSSGTVGGDDGGGGGDLRVWCAAARMLGGDRR